MGRKQKGLDQWTILNMLIVCSSSRYRNLILSFSLTNPYAMLSKSAVTSSRRKSILHTGTTSQELPRTRTGPQFISRCNRYRRRRVRKRSQPALPASHRFELSPSAWRRSLFRIRPNERTYTPLNLLQSFRRRPPSQYPFFQLSQLVRKQIFDFG